jgi:hypothetical protein
VISSFANEKSRKGFFLNLVVLALDYTDVLWCLHMYIHVMLCLLLQILFVADLDIKTRDAPTVSSINSSLSQYYKASHIFLQIFMYGGGGGRPQFVLTRLSPGQRPALGPRLGLDAVEKGGISCSCGARYSVCVTSLIRIGVCLHFYWTLRGAWSSAVMPITCSAWL